MKHEMSCLLLLTFSSILYAMHEEGRNPLSPASSTDDVCAEIVRQDALSSLDLRLEQLLIEEAELKSRPVQKKTRAESETISIRYTVDEEGMFPCHLEQVEEQIIHNKHAKKVAAINAFSAPCNALAHNLQSLEESLAQFKAKPDKKEEFETRLRNALRDLTTRMDETYAEYAPSEQKAQLKRSPSCQFLISRWKSIKKIDFDFPLKHDVFVFLKILEDTLVDPLQQRESF